MAPVRLPCESRITVAVQRSHLPPAPDGGKELCGFQGILRGILLHSPVVSVRLIPAGGIPLEKEIRTAGLRFAIKCFPRVACADRILRFKVCYDLQLFLKRIQMNAIFTAIAAIPRMILMTAARLILPAALRKRTRAAAPSRMVIIPRTVVRIPHERMPVIRLTMPSQSLLFPGAGTAGVA